MGGIDNPNAFSLCIRPYWISRQEYEPENTIIRALLLCSSTHAAKETHEHSIERLYLRLYGYRIR